MGLFEGGGRTIRNRYRFTKPPLALRRAHKDNLALVPANLLGDKPIWQQVANALPSGGALIVLPMNSPRQKRTLLAVAKLLAEDGHQIRVMPAEEVFRYRRPV